MTAELINNYKDGELKLDVFLHRPKAGETVEVKVMDKDKVIYDRKKSITSATDTLFTQQQVFTNARAWNAETPLMHKGNRRNPLRTFLASVPWK